VTCRSTLGCLRFVFFGVARTQLGGRSSVVLGKVLSTLINRHVLRRTMRNRNPTSKKKNKNKKIKKKKRYKNPSKGEGYREKIFSCPEGKSKGESTQYLPTRVLKWSPPFFFAKNSAEFVCHVRQPQVNFC
jgi:hypothetical protein